MQPLRRRKVILEQLNQNERVDIDQLALDLDVSAMTIRRDLSYLEEREKIIRTHGGAVLKSPLVIESSYQLKEGKNSFQKKQIAKTAVGYIQENSTIFLDSGTTTLEIAKLLKEKQNITVITNDILIAVELMNSQSKVIIIGGELQNNIGALFGPLTESILKDFHVDVLFLGAHAVDATCGVTAPTVEKAAVKRLMVQAAQTTWLVADSSKFHLKSLMKICELKHLDGLITDVGLSKAESLEFEDQLSVVRVGGEAI